MPGKTYYLEQLNNSKNQVSSSSSNNNNNDRIIVNVSIGDNLQIGNGILNGANIGANCVNGGGTGQTGGNTGNTGDQMCPSICELVHLEQFVSPSIVNRLGQNVIYTFQATNISGDFIPGPLLLSTSVEGKRILSITGLKSGESANLTINHIITSNDLSDLVISNLAFVANGVSTGIPGNFDIGERISNITNTSVKAEIPLLDVLGLLFVNRNANIPENDDLTLSLQLINRSESAIRDFGTDLSGILAGCIPSVSGSNPQNAFLLSDDGSLAFVRGFSLNPGETANININAISCPTCCNTCDDTTNLCTLNYRYISINNSQYVINRAIGIPKRTGGAL